MRKVIIYLLIGLVFNFSEVWAFSITSPADGAIVEAGSTITVQLDPSGVGEIVGVLFTGSRDMDSKFDVTPPYEWSIQIPRSQLGPLTLAAAARVLGQTTGQAPQASVTVIVRLPSNITLQSIQVDPTPKFLLLEPEIERQKILAITGVFSDGVKRNIASSTLGTTYKSSDERIVTVDIEGVLRAVGVGKAIISVKNGDKTAQIKVQVGARP